MEENKIEYIFNSIRFSNKINEIENILLENKEVTVSFEFNWDNYKSYIVIKGTENQDVVKLETPQIPLIGGVWSNFVATRCITGQIMVSAMIESVYTQLLFMVKKYNLGANIAKIDKCFYAPLMYYITDEQGNLAGSDIEKPIIKYSEILINKFPEQYKQIQELKSEYGIVSPDKYWKLNGYYK